MTITKRLHCPGRAGLATRMLGLELQRLGRRGARRLGRSRPQALSRESWRAPDSALARQAAELVGELSAPHLAHHCHRTWAFGVALATQHRRRFDAELLYVASLLHDLGLTETHRGDGPFELRGATVARAWCLDHGMPEERANLVHEAIALHTSLGAVHREPEIVYVHLGAGADVFGYHIEDVSQATTDSILEAWPRLGFKQALIEDLKPEVSKPDSPISGLWRLGFATRIKAAPFSE